MMSSQNIAILDLSTAISRKRCKLGGKLLLSTNRKSYISFRLVPKSVTLNDLERRNGRYFANSGSFRGALLKSSRSLSHLLMISHSSRISPNNRGVPHVNAVAGGDPLRISPYVIYR